MTHAMKLSKLRITLLVPLAVVIGLFTGNAAATEVTGGPSSPATAKAVKLSDADAENLIRRSLQYVALYNTLLNFSLNEKTPSPAVAGTRPITPKG